MLLLQLLFWRIRWIIEKQPIQGFLKALSLATQFYLWVFVPFTEALTAWETVLGGPLPLVMFLNPSKPPGRLVCLLIFSTVKEPRQNAHIGWTTLFHQEDTSFHTRPRQMLCGYLHSAGLECVSLYNDTLEWPAVLSQGREVWIPLCTSIYQQILQKKLKLEVAKEPWLRLYGHTSVDS